MIFNELTGSRIRLIAPTLEYLQNIHEYSVIPRLYDYLEYRPFKTLKETREFVNKLIAKSDDITGHYWFIYHLEDRKVIGTIGLVDIDERRGSAELGYGLSPDYWKNGFFSEA
ncbi:MAG: N-acetyltransferase, partial [Pedobacter sp.]